MSNTPRTDAYCKQILEDGLGLEYAATELQHLAEELERELAEAKRNYMELIMSVGNKYPNETRHETAKRYIQERENTPIHGPYSAIKELK